MKRILKNCALGVPQIRSVFDERNALRSEMTFLNDKVQQLEYELEQTKAMTSALPKDYTDTTKSDELNARVDVSKYFAQINEIAEFEIEGMKLFAHKNEEVTNFFFSYKYEESEKYNDFFFLDLLASKYGTVNLLDIGTNYGQDLLLLSTYLNKINALGSVIGYEPNQRVFELTKHNLRMNGLDACINQYAISDQSGATLLKGKMGNAEDMRIIGHTDPDFFQVVETRTLDEEISRFELKDAPLFIKIDTQGAEWKVFQGALNSLSMNKSVIKTEFIPAIYEDVSAVDFLNFLSESFIVIDAQSNQFLQKADFEKFCHAVSTEYLMYYTDLYLVPKQSEICVEL